MNRGKHQRRKQRFKIGVGKSMTVHNLLFYAHTICARSRAKTRTKLNKELCRVSKQFPLLTMYSISSDVLISLFEKSNRRRCFYVDTKFFNNNKRIKWSLPNAENWPAVSFAINKINFQNIAVWQLRKHNTFASV